MRTLIFTISIEKEDDEYPSFLATTDGLAFDGEEIEACGETICEAIRFLAGAIQDRATEWALLKHLESESDE